MTPDIERILNACVADLDWFIKIFEGAGDDERFQRPLERFHKLRARLELLRHTVTLALLRGTQDASQNEELTNELRSALTSELSRVLESSQRIEGRLDTTANQVAEMSRMISGSALEEVFRALLRAATRPGDSDAGPAALGGPRHSGPGAPGGALPGSSPSGAGSSPKSSPAPASPAKAQAAKAKAAEPAKVLAKVEDASPVFGSKSIHEFSFNRYHVDLETRSVRYERVVCQDYEDVLGGIARAFKVLEDHPVQDAYDPNALFILNLGVLSGSDVMTGLRTYFHGYSPLKVGESGKPGSMWSAGSCKFGTKLRFLDIDEVFFTGRSAVPVTLRVAPAGDEGGIIPEGRVQGDGLGALPAFHFYEATELLGKLSNDKIQELKNRWSDAHFAVIGPAGENFQNVRYAAIALSTTNQLRSGDNKPRFCGRGGFGGVMGSKNLIALVADGPDRLNERPKPSEALKTINQEIARGKGSARFRDAHKGNGGGGTWANYTTLGPVNAVPEYNFLPGGKGESTPLVRANVEAMDQYMVKDEACFRCGIACHKNVYDVAEVVNGKKKPGKFRAKLDFEPLNLLSSNIGIFDIDEACELVELVDLYCMDSISIGVTISYAMEYNKRHAASGKSIAGGLQYGDYHGTFKVIEAIGRGEMPELGQGVKRLSEAAGDTSIAMHCKGVEFPAYLPQTNPGYPWALAGGHMSMRTYLLLLYDRETGLDYWVDAITNRGPKIMRDDVIGLCKFAAINDDLACQAIAETCDLAIDAKSLQDVVMRTYLRGYRMERSQGFNENDYVMPAVAHEHHGVIDLPYFITPEFFEKLKTKVLQTFDERVAALKS